MNWYALRVRSRFELIATQLVCSRGYQAFSPVRQYTIRPGGRGRRELRMTALTPGYLFAKLPHGYAVHGYPMVYGVVGVAGEPSPVPADGIALLQTLSGRSERVTRLLREMGAKQLLRRVHAAAIN